MLKAYGETYYTPDGIPRYEPTLAYFMAKNNHYQRNKHHWNHFIAINDKGEMEVSPMDTQSILEMIVDWKAVADSKGSTVQSYYMKNSKQMVLHDKTRQVLDYSILGALSSFNDNHRSD